MIKNEGVKYLGLKARKSIFHGLSFKQSDCRSFWKYLISCCCCCCYYYYYYYYYYYHYYYYYYPFSNLYWSSRRLCIHYNLPQGGDINIMNNRYNKVWKYISKLRWAWLLHKLKLNEKIWFWCNKKHIWINRSIWDMYKKYIKYILKCMNSYDMG